MVLKTELELVLNEFAPMVNESLAEPSAAQNFTLEPQAAQKLLEKLEPLLKSGNPECLNLVNMLRVIKGSETLIERIEDFKFDAALESLKELKDGF
jgi:hypothetical protein